MSIRQTEQEFAALANRRCSKNLESEIEQAYKKFYSNCTELSDDKFYKIASNDDLTELLVFEDDPRKLQSSHHL